MRANLAWPVAVGVLVLGLAVANSGPADVNASSQPFEARSISWPSTSMRALPVKVRDRGLTVRSRQWVTIPLPPTQF